MHAIDRTHYEHFLEELEALDQDLIDVGGKSLKPSQCYHVGVDPTHVLFNSNCPESLKEKINAIMTRYRFQ